MHYPIKSAESLSVLQLGGGKRATHVREYFVSLLRKPHPIARISDALEEHGEFLGFSAFEYVGGWSGLMKLFGLHSIRLISDCEIDLVFV